VAQKVAEQEKATTVATTQEATAKIAKGQTTASQGQIVEEEETE